MKKNWNELSYEEKLQNVKQINETYDFDSYMDEACAATHVRAGYVEDPDWFNFAVTDLVQFENDVFSLILDIEDGK